MKILEKIVDKAHDNFTETAGRVMGVAQGVCKHYDPKGKAVYSKATCFGVMAVCVGENILYENIRKYVE